VIFHAATMREGLGGFNGGRYLPTD
jgi:hypothetical protein